MELDWSEEMADEVDSAQRKTEFILAEFRFVSGLITFYRRVEFTAAAGTGVALSIVVGAVAAIWTVDVTGPDGIVIGPDKRLAANLLAIEPWIQVLLLLLHVMALVRLRRAALYIEKHLAPFANKLPGVDDVLQFETRSTNLLVGETWGLHFLTRLQVTSTPVLLINWIPAVAFASVAAYVHPEHVSAPLVIASICAAGLATVIAAYGGVVTWAHEKDPEGTKGNKAAEPPSTAAAGGASVSGKRSAGFGIDISRIRAVIFFFRK